MNKSYKITNKEFFMFPKIKSQTISSSLIFFATFFITGILFNLGYYWGNMYPTAPQRGQPPQALVYKPITVPHYEFKLERVLAEKDIDTFAEKEVDDYTLKTALFRKRGLF